MPPRTRHRSLAELERHLHEHDAKRASLLEEIKTAAEAAGLDAMTTIARLGQASGLGASLPENTPTPPVRTPRPVKRATGSRAKKAAAKPKKR